MSNSSLIISVCLLWFVISHIDASTTILTSDIGGDNANVVICPNELVTLSCQTFSNAALVWAYPFNGNTGNTIYTQSNSINESAMVPITQGVINLQLTEIDGDNFTSVAIVNVTAAVTINCNSDGSTINTTKITISIRDLLPPPSNHNITNIQWDSISLTWDSILLADYYEVTINPSPTGGHCGTGKCVFTDTNATIDGLTVVSYDIAISGVNCAGVGASLSLTEDTIPTAIIDTNYGNDNGTIIICPNDPVNITCQTKNALVWLQTDNVFVNYVDSSLTDVPIDIDGFVFTLIEKDGSDVINLTSLLQANTNSSFNMFCSPTGAISDVDNNAKISVIVIDVLSRPNDVMTTSICYNSIELNWSHDVSADGYNIIVTPPPSSGVCANGTCDSTKIICGINGNCNISIGGLEPVQYTISVSSINCAGPSPANMITETIFPEAPSKPSIASLNIIDGNEVNVTVAINWNPPVDTCLTPAIDTYMITITSSSDTIVINTSNCCNITVQMKRCGVYSFTVRAVNSIGPGDPSFSKPLSTSELSQSVTTSQLQHDSVTIIVTVTECLIPAIVNVTMELSSLTALRIKTENFSYPSDRPSANLTVTGLNADTSYNITVTVFYNQSDMVVSLRPQMFSLQTSQNFELLEIGFYTGLVLFVVFGIILIIILIIGIACCMVYQRKLKRRLLKSQDEQGAKAMELQKNIEAIKETQTEVVRLANKSMKLNENKHVVTRFNEPPAMHTNIEEMNRHGDSHHEHTPALQYADISLKPRQPAVHAEYVNITDGTKLLSQLYPKIEQSTFM